MDSRNFTFMFYGFAAVWVILAVYVLSLVRRESRIKRELQNVKSMLDYREKAASR